MRRFSTILLILALLLSYGGTVYASYRGWGTQQVGQAYVGDTGGLRTVFWRGFTDGGPGSGK